MTLTLQLFKNSINTQEKLRLNLDSLSVSVSELLELTGVSLTLRPDSTTAKFFARNRVCEIWIMATHE
jgi:hypothetical protein